MSFNLDKIPRAFLLMSVFFFGVSILNGKYEFQIFAGLILIITLFGLFYNENQAPVVIAALGYQWLSITIAHFYLVFSDSTQKELLWRPEFSLAKIEQSYWLSILGLIAFALGFKMITKKINIRLDNDQLLQNYDTYKIIVLYVLFSITFDPLGNLLRFTLPGIFQVITVFAYFKWSLFFLMFYVSFKKNEYKSVVILILVIEILLGFTGYFAEFANFVMLFPIVYLSFNKIKDPKQILTIVLIIVVLVNFGAIWSYVKLGYRPYLSEGQRAQIVRVSKLDALNKLWELTMEVDRTTYLMGFEAMIKRVYALEYFSATMNHIPESAPFMKGQTWGKSLAHILLPRIFYPEKEAIDDSKQTYLLTGIRVADANAGVSISTGYMAESYADFGPVYMHLAIFVLGMMMGLIYKTLLSNSLNNLWGFALVFPMFFLLNVNGKSLIKIFGNTAYFFIIFYLIKRFGLPIIDQFIKKDKTAKKH